ncbi:hypothetical protein CVT26_000961 [Gymnopilus dilepis]|uniref:Uncharacterized protein n=1 Tax=Gymnopilus dilepis TaxID=231916 RepID=A0A409W762_9AGAR|nr:hypothetical protein CVT26_000961 [Gymnopilus dilepis]
MKRARPQSFTNSRERARAKPASNQGETSNMTESELWKALELDAADFEQLSVVEKFSLKEVNVS